MSIGYRCVSKFTLMTQVRSSSLSARHGCICNRRRNTQWCIERSDRWASKANENQDQYTYCFHPKQHNLADLKAASFALTAVAVTNLFTFSCQDSNDLNVCQNRGKDGLRNSLEAQNGQRSAAASFVAKLFTPYFSADLRAQFHLRFKIQEEMIDIWNFIKQYIYYLEMEGKILQQETAQFFI